MAKQQGVAINKIRYLDDGRFDFQGDVDAVLASIRGEEWGMRGKKRKSSSTKKSSTRKSTKTIMSSSSKPLKAISTNKGAENKTMNLVGKDQGTNSQANDTKTSSPHLSSGAVNQRAMKNTSAITPANGIKTSSPHQTQLSNASFQGNTDDQVLLNNISAITPAYGIKLPPPHQTQLSSAKPKLLFNNMQSPTCDNNIMLGDIFSPDIRSLTPLPVSSDNGINVFSPSIDINRNLFSLPTDELPQKSSKMMLEVAVSPIREFPHKIPHSERRRYFTTQSLEGSFTSFNEMKLPLSSSQGSKCLGVVPLRMSKANLSEDKAVTNDCLLTLKESVVCTPDNIAGV